MSTEDTSWVFDSLVAFLNGPIWIAPLENFIEEKSLIFEPSVLDNVEYKRIFDEFKNLVDFMLGNFMEDIGITPLQFQEACDESKRYHISFDKNIFEQIWAANDFQMFVKMMTQKNVELQLQALEMIETKYGITPQSFIPHGKTVHLKPEVAMDKQETPLEKKIMEEVSRKLAELDMPSSSEADNQMEEKALIEMSTVENSSDANIKMDAPIKTPVPTQKQVDSLDLKKRQEYLRAQRDKLVALKKEARQKQLTSETSSKKLRPKSAKAAEAVMNGDKSSIDVNQLQIRKALADRLKAEVVDKTN